MNYIGCIYHFINCSRIMLFSTCRG